MAKIKDTEGKFTLDPSEAITKIQLLTKTSSENDTSLADIQLDLGEPLFDPNNTEGKQLHIGARENKVSFYGAEEVDAKINGLDYTTTNNPTSTNNFVSEVTQTDGKIAVTYTQPAASNVSYSSSTGRLSSDNVQSAIDEEVEARISAIEALDSASSEASAGSFLTYVQLVNGKISETRTASNAATASKWETAHSITLTGDVSGSVSIDGSEDVSILTTVADDSHNHIIDNVDNLQSELNSKAPENHASTSSTYGVATGEKYGHVQIGTNITVDNGIISVSTAGDNTLGLVKSGGDVTISDGVITVNNNSHNHIIDDVTDLRTSLNTKLDKIGTDNIVIKDVGETFKYLEFRYSNDDDATPASIASWRLGNDGTGSENTNYFRIQSTKSSGTSGFTDALRIGMDDHDLTVDGAIIANTFNGATITSTSFNGAIITADGAITAGKSGDQRVTAGSFNATSDARLKENFQPLTPEKSILDLPTYKFDFINGAKNQIGCKAQDLQEICPEIVNEGDDGYLSIQESKIVYLLLEEVKKLRKEIDDLKGLNF